MGWGGALFAAWGLLGGSPPNAVLPDARMTPGADVKSRSITEGLLSAAP